MNYIVGRQTNCPNCNAVLVSDVCEYCGTRTGWEDARIEAQVVTIPIEINGNFIDEIKKLGAIRQ